MREAMAARRKKEGRPEGRKVPRGGRQAAPRRRPRPVAAAAADDRPVRGRPLGRGAAVVRPGLPLQPLRRAARPCATPSAVRSPPARPGRRRADPAAAQLPQEPDQAGRRAPRSSAARSRGSPSTSSARAPGGPCTPASPAATPATTRPRRCSPSRRCAWPSTTTRRPRARSPPPTAMAEQPAGPAAEGRDEVRDGRLRSARRCRDHSGEQRLADAPVPRPYAGRYGEQARAGVLEVLHQPVLARRAGSASGCSARRGRARRR